jgi:hypothetical protein
VKSFVLLVVVCSAFFLISCGGGGSSSTSSSTMSTPSAIPNISGNYDLTATSQVVANTSFIGGALNSDSAGHITGTMHVAQSSCYSLITDVPVTGTVNAQGQLSVTTASVGSQVVNVTANVSSDASTISSGTYTITGGCAGGDHGTITGFRMQPFTATYSGNFISVFGPPTVSVSVPLSQSSTADSDGFFHITGTATIGGTTCFSSATVSNSVVAGEAMLLELTTNTGATIDFVGLATDSSAKTVSGNYSVSGGACSGDHGTGTVSHP